MVSSVLKKLDLSYESIEKDLPDYINSGLMVLYKRQHDDNGWGWYENDETDPYMTAYVLYGLLEAQKILPETGIGITVDEKVISRGIASLISQLPAIKEDSVRVYALYVLSHTDRIKQEWLDEMYAKKEKLTSISKAMLLLAYENAGVEGKAKVLYEMLLSEKIEENGYVHWGYVGEEYYWWDWEADPLETTAYVLRAMAKRDIENPLITKAIRWLIINRTGSYWRSTKATGKIIYALCDYLSRTGEMNPDYDLVITLNGETLLKHHVKKGSTLEGLSPVVVPGEKLLNGENQIKIKKDGPGNIYFSSTFTCYRDQKEIAPQDRGFSLIRKYFILEKTAVTDGIVYTKRPLSGPIKSGDEVLVELQLSVDKRCSYAVIEDYFPAGFEPIKEDENYTIGGDSLYTGDYFPWYAGREFRDERIAISASYLSGGTHIFEYILRAQIPGTFEVMPAEAYLMYFPGKYGRTANDRITVLDSQ